MNLPNSPLHFHIPLLGHGVIPRTSHFSESVFDGSNQILDGTKSAGDIVGLYI